MRRERRRRAPRRARPGRRSRGAGRSRAASARGGAPRCSGPGRAGDGPDERQPAVAAVDRGPARPPAARAARGAGGSPSSWSSAAPAFEVRTSTKQPAPAAAAAPIRGSSESRPSSGFAVKASAPRPGHVAERARRAAHERLRDRRLAVTGTSPRLPSANTSRPWSRAIATDLLERLPAGRAEPLEARELRLDRDTRGPGGDDRRTAVLGHRLRGARARQVRRVRASADARERLRPQRCRVGVEPEHDTTAALLHERRQPVGEMQRRRAPGSQGLIRR